MLDALRDSKFCMDCGAELVNRAKYCHICGGKLIAADDLIRVTKHKDHGSIGRGWLNPSFCTTCGEKL